MAELALTTGDLVLWRPIRLRLILPHFVNVDSLFLLDEQAADIDLFLPLSGVDLKGIPSTDPLCVLTLLFLALDLDTRHRYASLQPLCLAILLPALLLEPDCLKRHLIGSLLIEPERVCVDLLKVDLVG